MMNKPVPWNKGKSIGPKLPLKPSEIWNIRARLSLSGKQRDLALFNLAIDSKLRGCDLVKLRVSDVSRGGAIFSRASVVQQKTGSSVVFEITDITKTALLDWFDSTHPAFGDFIFKSRTKPDGHLSTKQYDRLVHEWVKSIGLDDSRYGTHSLRRTKVSILYRRDKNLRAIQLLLGHKKIESTVRYLGIDVEDALEASAHLDI